MQPLIVTAAVIRHEDRVLITRRPQGKRHGGWWEFPGGKLDPDESPQEGLRREIVEELAIEVAVGGIFEVVYYRYDWGPVLILAFSCIPLSLDIRDIGVAEHRWVLPSELADYEILPADAPILEKIQAGA